MASWKTKLHNDTRTTTKPLQRFTTIVQNLCASRGGCERHHKEYGFLSDNNEITVLP